jgi:hypothetical protein
MARLDEGNMVRLGAALSELNAHPRGVDADKGDINPTDPRVLANGASFTMDTDAGPPDSLIRMKHASGRERNLLDIHQLRALANGEQGD